MVQLSATMEQTRETQQTQLYDVLGFRRVIARYDVLSTLHETGPRLLLHLLQNTWDVSNVNKHATHDVRYKDNAQLYQ